MPTRNPQDLTRESVELVQVERKRAREKGHSISLNIDATLNDWELTASDYFGRARDLAERLDVDGDGDIDAEDVERAIVKFAGIGVAWLDSFRASHDR